MTVAQNVQTLHKMSALLETISAKPIYDNNSAGGVLTPLPGGLPHKSEIAPQLVWPALQVSC
jgi:hypothetical protein